MKSELITKNEQQVTVFNPFLSELAKLEEEAKKQVFDYEDPEGNKQARSYLAKLRKSRKAVEKAGLAERNKTKVYTSAVMEAEREITSRIIAIIDIHQKPIDEIQKREDDRKAAIDEKLDRLQNFMNDVKQFEFDSVSLKDNITQLEDMEPDESYDEYMAEGMRLWKRNIDELKSLLEDTVKREEDQAELDRLRKESEDRERVEREERIANEAAEAARIAAERHAKELARVEADKAARKEMEAQEAIKAAELAKQQAEKRAEQAKADAIREQQEKEQAEREAAAKREANKKHHDKINNEAMKGFVDGGLSESDAKKAVELIAKKLIKNVTITY